jgi:hypothetical protein
MKHKIPLSCLLLVTLLTACGGRTTPIQIDFPTIEPDPTATSMATPGVTEAQPTETLTPTESPTPSNWFEAEGCEPQAIEPVSSEPDLLIFESEELGVEFEYPAPTGNYRYKYTYLLCHSPSWDRWPTYSGIFWIIEAVSPSDAGRFQEFFAGAVSSDHIGYVSESPADVIRFRRTSGAYYLDFIDGREFEVEPRKIIKHPDGPYALVYNPQENLGPEWPDELVIVMMLPEGYSKYFEAINIRLLEEQPIDFVEELIYAIRFLDLP